MSSNPVQLNELKEYLDYNKYGAWVNVDGRVENVDAHEDWLRKNYPYGGYDAAFDTGWVRFVNGERMSIEGFTDDIKKTFKYWWPSVRKAIEVFVEPIESGVSDIFDIPKDLSKLRNTYKPEKKLKEAIKLNELKEYLDSTEYGGWIMPNKKIEYVEFEGHYDRLIDYSINGYEEAFLNGWVRFVFEPDGINLQGDKDALRKTFRIWWPSVINRSSDNYRSYAFFEFSDDNKQIEYELPKDKSRILKQLGPESKLSNESNQLNEIRNPIDTSGYGGWLHPAGRVEVLDGELIHASWAEKYLGVEKNELDFPEVYRLMYEKGWIRFVTSGYPAYFDISGYKKDLAKSFKIWYPAALDSGRVHMDVYGNDAERSIESYRYEMPYEKAKLIKDWRLMKEATQMEDRFYDNKNVKLHDRDLNSSRYNITLFKHEVTENNGNWNETITPIEEKNGLSYPSALRWEMKLENKASKLQKNVSEGPGWSDYFIRIEESDMNEEYKEREHSIRKKEDQLNMNKRVSKEKPKKKSFFKRKKANEDKHKELKIRGKEEDLKRKLMTVDDKKKKKKSFMDKFKKGLDEAIGASTFIKVGKHLIEMQPSWINEGKERHARWDIFVDGRGVGYVDQLSENRFKAQGEDDAMESIEEAVSFLIKAKGRGIHFKQGNAEADRLRILSGLKRDI